MRNDQILIDQTRSGTCDGPSSSGHTSSWIQSQKHVSSFLHAAPNNAALEHTNERIVAAKLMLSTLVKTTRRRERKQA